MKNQHVEFFQFPSISYYFKIIWAISRTPRERERASEKKMKNKTKLKFPPKKKRNEPKIMRDKCMQFK